MAASKESKCVFGFSLSVWSPPHLLHVGACDELHKARRHGTASMGGCWLTRSHRRVNTWWVGITHAGKFDQSAGMQQQGAQLWSISNATPWTHQNKPSALFVAFLFNVVWNTQKKHNGWHRMVSTFPEDITDARSSEQLWGRLKDMTDCPNIAPFKSEVAAAAFHVSVCGKESLLKLKSFWLMISASFQSWFSVSLNLISILSVTVFNFLAAN